MSYLTTSTAKRSVSYRVASDAVRALVSAIIGAAVASLFFPSYPIFGVTTFGIALGLFIGNLISNFVIPAWKRRKQQHNG